MSKKTLKTARGRRRKYNEKSKGQYGPSSFDPPETTKDNIRNITNYLVKQVSGMGMTVVVSCSRVSKSRYLSVDAGMRPYTIRVSDHALKRNRKKHDFNVYTHIPYEKSYHYLAFLEEFREITGRGNEGQNLEKPRIFGEI